MSIRIENKKQSLGRQMPANFTGAYHTGCKQETEMTNDVIFSAEAEKQNEIFSDATGKIIDELLSIIERSNLTQTEAHIARTFLIEGFQTFNERFINQKHGATAAEALAWMYQQSRTYGINHNTEANT
jgi:hypothetical protein